MWLPRTGELHPAPGPAQTGHRDNSVTKPEMGGVQSERRSLPNTKVKEKGFGGHSAPLILTEAVRKTGAPSTLFTCNKVITTDVFSCANSLVGVYVFKSPKKYRLKDS